MQTRSFNGSSSHSPASDQHSDTSAAQSLAVRTAHQHLAVTFFVLFRHRANEMTEALSCKQQMYRFLSNDILIHHLPDLQWQLREEKALTLRIGLGIQMLVDFIRQADHALPLSQRAMIRFAPTLHAEFRSFAPFLFIL